MLLSEAARLCSQAVRRRIRSENSYSSQDTYRQDDPTCSKCGHKREYDMATMRFLTRAFRQYLVKSKATIPGNSAPLCSELHLLPKRTAILFPPLEFLVYGVRHK
jgi:hypothetical protein